MNTIAAAILLSVFAFSANAQKGKATETSLTTSPASPSNSMFDVQMAAYRNAMNYYDIQAASVALYVALALNPQRTDLNDSLAYLYFAGERFGQAYLIGEEILKRDSKRNDIREIVAVSKQSLNMVKEALVDYEALYAATNDLQYLYQMATIQYQLKRFGECLASLDKIIADPAAAQQKVSLRIQEGGSQNVVMKAAAHNIKGICAMEVSQNDAALEQFNKAVEIFPEFVLAKNNLNFLKQQMAQGAGKGTGTQPAAPSQKK